MLVVAGTLGAVVGCAELRRVGDDAVAAVTGAPAPTTPEFPGDDLIAPPDISQYLTGTSGLVTAGVLLAAYLFRRSLARGFGKVAGLVRRPPEA